MTDSSKVSTFNTATHREMVAAMEDVIAEAHLPGKRFFAEYGTLHPLVQVHGKIKVSHNSLVAAGTADKWVLQNGIAMPNLDLFDLTGSVGEKVALVFAALGVMDAMSAPLKKKYNMQRATAGLQDVMDVHGGFMMTEFETDNRIAEQLRLLIPDLDGKDPTEEYLLAALYAAIAMDLDIWKMYELKGHLHFIGDQIGYPSITKEHAKTHLGHTIQAEMTSFEVIQALLAEWHPFYFNIGGERRAPNPSVTDWWLENLGANRVVEVHDMDLLDEALMATTWAVETEKPTLETLSDFLLADGANTKIGSSDIKTVWKWLQDIAPHFGDQTRMAGYGNHPMPGAIFSDQRFAWADDDPRAVGQKAFPGAAKSAKDLTAKPARQKWESKNF